MRRRDFITLLGCAAVAWPLHAHAQQPAMPVIGFMSARSPEESAHLVEAFRRGLREGGFAENEKVAIEFRWAKGDYGRLPALAAELVNRRVNVLTAVGGDPSALAAKRATSVIPIVFATAGDPIGSGLVATLARPGGNVTGVSSQGSDAAGKRLELLREVVPGLRRFAVLANLASSYPALELGVRHFCTRSNSITFTRFTFLSVVLRWHHEPSASSTKMGVP